MAICITFGTHGTSRLISGWSQRRTSSHSGFAADENLAKQNSQTCSKVMRTLSYGVRVVSSLSSSHQLGITFSCADPAYLNRSQTIRTCCYQMVSLCFHATKLSNITD